MRAGLQEFGDEAAPAGLMRCAHAAPVVAVKVFVEEDVVLEVRVGGELRVILQHGALTVLAFQEQPREPVGEFAGDFVDGQEFPRAGGAFDLEIVAIIVMEFLQGFR